MSTGENRICGPALSTRTGLSPPKRKPSRDIPMKTLLVGFSHYSSLILSPFVMPATIVTYACRALVDSPVNSFPELRAQLFCRVCPAPSTAQSRDNHCLLERLHHAFVFLDSVLDLGGHGSDRGVIAGRSSAQHNHHGDGRAPLFVRCTKPHIPARQPHAKR